MLQIDINSAHSITDTEAGDVEAEDDLWHQVAFTVDRSDCRSEGSAVSRAEQRMVWSGMTRGKESVIHGDNSASVADTARNCLCPIEVTSIRSSLD